MSAFNAGVTDSRWNWLYKLGGAATLIMVVLVPIQIIVFIVSPPPSAVIDYFTVFQSNRLLGLLDLDFLLIVDNVLAIALYLALYVALRRASESFIAIATTLGLISIVLFVASREATFAMSSLSDQYAAATTDAQRAMFLTIGQTLLAIYNGAAFQVSYVLGAVALLIISVVMLRSDVFSKAAAYLGILANVLAFGLYVPAIGVFISVFSVIFLWIWDILIVRRFFQLGRFEGKGRTQYASPS